MKFSYIQRNRTHHGLCSINVLVIIKCI